MIKNSSRIVSVIPITLAIIAISVGIYACKPSDQAQLRPKINLYDKAQDALKYCKQNNMNTDLCILIDMSIHSGLDRLFVWDFNKKEVAIQSLVSHGCGNNRWSGTSSKSNPSFSNTPDTHLSSLGKYKIGERGYSQWGVHSKYLLHGLEASNRNALRRQIVFHSWDAIADTEVYPRGTPEGWGCPAISNNSFRTIDPLIRYVDKPVLMWIFH